MDAATFALRGDSEPTDWSATCGALSIYPRAQLFAPAPRRASARAPPRGALAFRRAVRDHVRRWCRAARHISLGSPRTGWTGRRLMTAAPLYPYHPNSSRGRLTVTHSMAHGGRLKCKFHKHNTLFPHLKTFYSDAAVGGY